MGSFRFDGALYAPREEKRLAGGGYAVLGVQSRQFEGRKSGVAVFICHTRPNPNAGRGKLPYVWGKRVDFILSAKRRTLAEYMEKEGILFSSAKEAADHLARVTREEADTRLQWRENARKQAEDGHAKFGVRKGADVPGGGTVTFGYMGDFTMDDLVILVKGRSPILRFRSREEWEEFVRSAGPVTGTQPPDTGLRQGE